MIRSRPILVASLVAIHGCTAPARDNTKPSAPPDTVADAPLDSAAAEFYASLADEYEAERRAIAGGPGRVSRRPGTLRISTRSGRIVTFIDAISHPDSHINYLYARFMPTLDAHVLRKHYYEGWAYDLVNDSTGRTTHLADVPVVAPAGTRFVVASLDLDANYSPNTIEIWRTSADSILKEFDLDGGEIWGPDSVTWIGSDTIRFVRVVRNRSDFTDSHFVHWLVRQDSRWGAQPSIP